MRGFILSVRKLIIVFCVLRKRERLATIVYTEIRMKIEWSSYLATVLYFMLKLYVVFTSEYDCGCLFVVSLVHQLFDKH